MTGLGSRFPVPAQMPGATTRHIEMERSWLPVAPSPGLDGLLVIGNCGRGRDNGMGGNADENGHDGGGNDDDGDVGDDDHFIQTIELRTLPMTVPYRQTTCHLGR